MPKVKIYCEMKSSMKSSTKSSPSPSAPQSSSDAPASPSTPSPTKDEYNFEFCREVEVPSNDLTAFYYAVRNYFRKELTSDERDLIAKHIPDNKEALKLMKRRKNVTLKDVFPNNYYVEGVDKVGPNRYQLLWGL